MSIDVNRERAIDLALSQIEKQFGKGAIMRLGEAALAGDIPALPTGSLGLDIALGIVGIPRGRVVEIYGPESSGKPTLELQLIAEGQKRGGICAFIDAEHALDVGYARKLGVRTEDLLISQPDHGEQALEIADTLVRSGALDVLVIDSVAALVPRAEIEGDMGDPEMGLQGRLLSQALRKLTGTISKSRTIVVFINQIRMKIGCRFGNPGPPTGGNALKFYASVRLDIRRPGALKHGDEVIGSRTKVKVVKNKVAPPFREAEFDILYGTGISKEGELIDIASEQGIVEKTGAWYAFGGDRIGQGRENARDFLREHPEVAAQIEAKVREKFGLRSGAAEGGNGASAEGVRAAEAARRGGGGKNGERGARSTLAQGRARHRTRGRGTPPRLAAIIDHNNRTADRHIITIEDPIEYLHRDEQSIVTQREIGADCVSFAAGLKGALRQDPDVILVGEMRDLETIETAILAAETGHLVMSTLHTLDAPETVTRVISAFPDHQRGQARLILASILKGCISQRLVPRADGHGMVPAVEVMVSTGLVKECITQPERTRELRDAIARGYTTYGMQTFDQSLMALWREGLVTFEEALAQSTNPDDFALKARGISSTSDARWDDFDKEPGETAEEPIKVDRF